MVDGLGRASRSISASAPDERPGAGGARRARLAGLDLLVTTGGASVGDYDLVQQALGREGLELDFWKIAMRPGKPLLFGRLGAVPVLGFPGNPVSTGGLRHRVPARGAAEACWACPSRCRSARPSSPTRCRANDQRQDYLRAGYVDGSDRRRVRTAARQDSSMLATFAAADALVVRPPFDPAREARRAWRPIVDLHEALDNLR